MFLATRQPTAEDGTSKQVPVHLNQTCLCKTSISAHHKAPLWCCQAHKRVCPTAQITGRSRKLVCLGMSGEEWQVYVDRVSAAFIIPSYVYIFIQHKHLSVSCFIGDTSIYVSQMKCRCSCISAFALLLEKYFGGCRGGHVLWSNFDLLQGCFCHTAGSHWCELREIKDKAS